MHMLNKIFSALINVPCALKKTKSPRLIMTLLVKNEEALLEDNLIFHKSMGVDAFIITDNNSTDTTPQIIKKYKALGWIIEVINETATDYKQKKWVDRMIFLAINKHHADWIINADADELWHSPSGNLKNEINNTRSNVLVCEMKCMYPDENLPFYLWNRAVNPIVDYEKYDLSPYSLFCKQNKKVAHRAKGYIQISMGNHNVKMIPKISKKSDITVYHYNIRGRQPFICKMINGGQQLERSKQRHGGRHWRYFYQLYNENKLNDEYDRVIGINQYDNLCKDGYIYYDTTISDYFKNKLANE